jgi:hypothetical protein
VILSKISNEELDTLNKLTKDKKVREEMLKDHQPNNLGIDLMQLEKIIICLKDREILVILDNLEDPLINDEKDLKMILQKILGECTSIKFLSTSRIQLNQVGNTEEVVHELKHLSNEWAVDLFLEKANLNLNDL